MRLIPPVAVRHLSETQKQKEVLNQLQDNGHQWVMRLQRLEMHEMIGLEKVWKELKKMMMD